MNKSYSYFSRNLTPTPTGCSSSSALCMSQSRSRFRLQSNSSERSQKKSQSAGAASSSSSSLSSLSRRQVGELAVATTGLGVCVTGTREATPTSYGLWGLLPVATYRHKPTLRETIIPQQIWTLEQKFGILNVHVPLRMTIIRMMQNNKKKAKTGGTGGTGLLVYNPIAATPQCLALVQELVDQYGPVRHIVVGSVALEHKAYASVFAQKFKHAHVWLQPGQYSYPLQNLPLSFLGFPASRTHVLPTMTTTGSRTSSSSTSSIKDEKEEEEAMIRFLNDEWRDDFEWATLGPIISRDGAFGETVLFHKPSQTLLVTDTVVQVTDHVPELFDDDPAPLLYHARDTISDRIDFDRDPDLRIKAWRRIVLFGLYFMPSAITVQSVQEALQNRRPDINRDFAGVYPWEWNVEKEQQSWQAIAASATTRKGKGKVGGLLVPPILQVLLLNRSPIEVLDFAQRVAQWPIQRILPAHLQNNIAATGKDYRAAFQFLTAAGVLPSQPRPLPADLHALREAEQSLLASHAIAPAPSPFIVSSSISRGEVLAQTVYACRAGVCQPRAPLVAPE